MKEIKKIHIDKYLSWYEGLSIKQEKFNQRINNLERLDIAIAFLANRWLGATSKETGIFGALKAGLATEKNFTLSKLYWEKLVKEKEELHQLTDSDDEFLMKNNAQFVGNATALYYLPSIKDWEYLAYYRKSNLLEANTNIENLLKRTLLSREDQLIESLQAAAAVVKESVFYNNAMSAKPIYNLIINDESKDLGSGNKWVTFLYWVHQVDLLNLLIDKIGGVEIESVSTELMQGNLKWEASVNTLYTLFYDLLESRLITWNGKGTEGEKMEIARMLSTHFVNKSGEPLSIEMIKQSLKPGTPKAKQRLDLGNLALLMKRNI